MKRKTLVGVDGNAFCIMGTVSGTAAKSAPAVAKFALDGNAPMVARINAPAGTVVYLGSGFMPNASSYSARAVVGENCGLIGIPAGVTSAYLLVETTSL